MSDATFSIVRSPDWEDVPTGRVPSLMRKGRSNNNALQFSLNENMSGRPLNPPPDPLELARALAKNMNVRIEATSGGACDIGEFARIVFSTPRLAYGEAWVLTDGMHVGIATYSCDALPDEEELAEVAAMAKSMKWAQPWL